MYSVLLTGFSNSVVRVKQEAWESKAGNVQSPLTVLPGGSALPRRAKLVALLAGLAVLTACGTTVPLAQQQASSGTQGLSAPTDAGTAGAGPDAGSAPGASGPLSSSPGGSSGGSGAGSGTGPGQQPSTASAAAAAAAGIPGSGPGWDVGHVYIGIPTADDFDTTVRAAGASSSNGDVHGDINAIVASINQAGGVLGRKVVAIYHDAKTTDYAYNAAGTAQAMCTYFTQDRPVAAVVNGSPQLDGAPNFHSCLESKKVSLLSLANTDYTDADYQRLGPHLWTTGSLSTDVLVPSFVSALGRQHFFTPWDVRAGAAGVTPAKVGALLPDTPQGRHVGVLMDASLKKLGLKLDSSFYYDPVGLGSKSQAEVLQFSSAGITHLLDLPPIAAEIWLFQAAAEQQQYRPRYGFTSFNLPLSVEENSSVVPPRQQIGSMGIGWQPYNDTNATHDQGPTPGSPRCLSALARGGQKFSSTQRRGELIAVQLCDSIFLLRDAFLEGRGFTGSHLLAGMPLAGPRLPTAGTFSGGLSSTDHGMPGSYRAELYQSACSCFTYIGATQRFAR